MRRTGSGVCIDTSLDTENHSPSIVIPSVLSGDAFRVKLIIVVNIDKLRFRLKLIGRIRAFIRLAGAKVF